jgi:hypothetical protein
VNSARNFTITCSRQRESPASFEQAFRGFFNHGCARVPTFCLGEVDGNQGLAASPFQRSRPVPFVGQEMLDRRQQKGSEPAALRISIKQAILTR